MPIVSIFNPMVELVTLIYILGSMKPQKNIGEYWLVALINQSRIMGVSFATCRRNYLPQLAVIFH